MASKDEWCDRCDSIKETDPRYAGMQRTVSASGCAKENKSLTDCLNSNKKDFRKCMAETENLKVCMSGPKTKQPSR